MSSFLIENHSSIPELPSPIIDNWSIRNLVKAKYLFRIFNRVYKRCNSVSESLRLLNSLRDKHRKMFSTGLMNKITKVDGRHYWHLFAPGAPSVAAQKAMDYEITREMTGIVKENIRILIIAITKKCSLRCKHCFEWDQLNQNDVLSRQDLIDIVKKFQKMGVSVFWLGGGEPMLRFNDILYILQNQGNISDFWLVTSGYKLHDFAAKQLKSAGLTGVIISLDHYLEDYHNQFRGNKNAFSLAIRASKCAKEAGLVTALSLCATREFISEENVRKYMKMAQKLGVSFVQILEPKAAGRYAGKDVALYPEHIKLLEKLYLEYNTSCQYRSFPIIDYMDYHKRRIGCFPNGKRMLYIDTNGAVHSCPFCRDKLGNSLRMSNRELFSRSWQRDCREILSTEKMQTGINSKQ